jgi:hypothetical protein
MWSSFCHWIQHTPVGTAVGGSDWAFPAIETVHLLGMILLVGSVATFDLRLLGFLMPRQSVSRLAGRLLPGAWVGFSVMAVTGTLLFASDAIRKYGPNPVFPIKMLLIFLAGVNMLIFHSGVYRRVENWDDAPVTPLRAKVAGCCSLLLWTGVITAGRWIGFA